MADMTLKEMLNKLIDAANPIPDEEIDEICDDDEGEPVPLEAVLFVPQTLTEAQKAQARDNVGVKDLNKYLTQEAGNSATLVMSQAATTKLVEDALGTGGSTEYETVDSIEEMTDTSKQYILSTTGTIWTYRETVVEVEPPNKFVPSTATINARLSGSSGSVTAGNGAGSFVTDFIAVNDMATVSPYTARLNFVMQTSEDNKVVYYNTSKARIGNAVYISPYTSYIDENGLTALNLLDTSEVGAAPSSWADVAYVRLQLFIKAKGTNITSEDIADVSITFDHEGGTRTEAEWYDTGLTPSASGGGGNYVTLLAKINENTADINHMDKRVTALETGAETLPIPDWWTDAVDACIAKIKALQVGRQCITFPFFSDNHTRNGYAGVMIAKIMQECHIPYCIYGGDSIDSGYIANEATMIAQDAAFDQMMSYVPNGRLCRAVGNHDGYWAVSADEKHYYTREQVYELFLREESVAQNKHYGADGTYYYIDEIASKIRFVILNTNGGSVDATQLAWVTDTALKLPADDWAVVMISHQPISNHYHSNISNAAAVISAVNAAGVEIIGWFSGHIHRDRIYTGIATNTTTDAQGAALGFTQVTITSDHTGIAYDDATKHTVANDDQSHAIDFVTINRATRKVSMTRLGIGNDRSYTF